MEEIEQRLDAAESRRRWYVLGLILAVLGAVKLAYSVGAGPYGLDASYYFQIARNFADGIGLKTSVSLYHFGLQHLPEPVAVYPLWPVVLGYAGRWLGMTRAVEILPRLLYLIDLFLMYWVVRWNTEQTWGRSLISSRPIGFDAGHLAVLLLGLNQMFFSATTHPYTEGLAFLLVLGSFLSLARMSRTETSPGLALVAGLCAGLAFLTRTQMIICWVGGAAAIALIVAVRRDRWKELVAFCVPLAASWAIWRWVIVEAATGRGSDAIAPYQMWVPVHGLVAWVRERLVGLAVGFAIGNPDSYVTLFGPLAFLGPVAAIVLLFRMMRRHSSWKPEPRMLGTLAMLVTGIAGFATLNLFHETFFRPWLFSWRHGIPYLFLLVPALLYLWFAGGRATRWTLVLVVLVSLGLNASHVFRFTWGPHPGKATVGELQASAWLKAIGARNTTVLTTHAQTLATLSRANFHWTLCEESPEQTRKMLENLPIDYVFAYEWEAGCSFQARSKLGADLRPVMVFGQPGDRIFVLAPTEELLRRRREIMASKSSEGVSRKSGPG